MHRLISTVCFAVISYIAFAQQIALPPNTVEGYLRNGMHYIIKPNSLPQHTIEFRLIMQVGSLQENEEQRGGAHFLEHMSFAGMKEFPDNAMVDYFERQGMKYGRDINAFTGFDRTIYWFTVPTFGNTTTTIDTTLMVVRGILSDITFHEERTQKERGVIVEELRSYDTRDPFYQLKIGNGRHARHMPLGDEDDILHIDRQKLLDFYHQWYTPQFATLVVVGNIEAQEMERRIKHYLDRIPQRGADSIQAYPLTYEPGIQLMEISDSLNNSSKLELIIPHTVTPVATIEQAVQKARQEMLATAVSNRLSAAKIPCVVSDKWYLADKNHFVLSFNGRHPDSLLTAITRAASEIKYLATKGPAPKELQELIAEKTHRLRCDTTEVLSGKWCEDFTDYVIVGDRHIYQQTEVEAIRQGVAQTTLEQIRSLVQSLLKDIREHLLIAYQNHQEQASLSEKQCWEAWQAGSSEKAYPFVVRKETDRKELPCPVPTILTQPHPYDTSEIVLQKTYDELRIHEVQLRNGVRLLFRPTLDHDKRLQLVVLGRGGTADLNDDDYYRLRDAVAYMDMGGIEGIPDQQLGEVMGQRNISMNIGLEDQWHQLMTTADRDDAQILMNLAYEKMHHPQKNYLDFEESRASEMESWGQETLLSRLMRIDSERMMKNCIDSVVGNVISRRPTKKADLEAMNLDEMAVYYHRLYTNPRDLTIILTGNYELQKVMPLAIGTFARMQQPDSLLPVNDEPTQPIRKYEQKFDHDNPSQTIFNYIFAGNYYPSLKTTLTFKLMRDLLQQRLLEVMRERENIVYSPYSDLAYHGLPQRTYYFWLTIAVKNENIERMKAALKEIITSLQDTPVSTRELNKMKRSFIVTKRQQLNDVAPIEWKNIITTLLKNGESLESFNRYDDVLEEITPETIRTAFCNYIDTDYYILMYKAK